jgi:hypothetical protein
MNNEMKKRKKDKKKKGELKSSKHRSSHVLDWTRHQTRDKQNLIDWQIVIRRSTIDCRWELDELFDEVFWFLTINLWIFSSQEKKRRVDVIIWSDIMTNLWMMMCCVFFKSIYEDMSLLYIKILQERQKLFSWIVQRSDQLWHHVSSKCSSWTHQIIIYEWHFINA